MYLYIGNLTCIMGEMSSRMAPTIIILKKIQTR